MRAINYYLVIDKIKKEHKKIAGLIITDNIDEEGRYSKAKVISAGDKVEGIKDGDIINYDSPAAHAITWNENVYYVIKLGDVITVE